jgi:hypothetical protein
MATLGAASGTDDDDEATDREVRLTNRMAAFTGRARGVSAGSARRETLSLVEGEQRVFELEVLPGSEAILIELGPGSDPEADLDLSLFDCSDEEEGCQAARVDGDPVGDERILLMDPEAGRWVVVVDAFDVPEGTTEVAYLDVVLNPAYGAVHTTDLPQERNPEDRWLVRVGVSEQDGAHPTGRVPFTGLLVTAEVGDDEVPVALTEIGGR